MTTAFVELKRRVLNNMVVPSSVDTIAFVLQRPTWQVRYAVESLVASGIVEPSGKLFRMCEPKQARSRVK